MSFAVEMLNAGSGADAARRDPKLVSPSCGRRACGIAQFSELACVLILFYKFSSFRSSRLHAHCFARWPWNTASPAKSSMTAYGRSRCRIWSPNWGPPLEFSPHCCDAPISRRHRPDIGCGRNSESLSSSRLCRQHHLDVSSRWCWIPRSRALRASRRVPKRTPHRFPSLCDPFLSPRLKAQRRPRQNHVRHSRRR